MPPIAECPASCRWWLPLNGEGDLHLTKSRKNPPPLVAILREKAADKIGVIRYFAER